MLLSYGKEIWDYTDKVHIKHKNSKEVIEGK